MKKFMMNMPDDLHKRLKLYAAECGTDMTSIVLEAIKNHLPTKVYVTVSESPRETLQVMAKIYKVKPKSSIEKKPKK